MGEVGGLPAPLSWSGSPDGLGAGIGAPGCARSPCVHPGARAKLGISHLLLLLGEGAEEQGEPWVELFPWAHLPERYSGTHSPEGVMLPAGG